MHSFLLLIFYFIKIYVVLFNQYFSVKYVDSTIEF